ncbi:hypothetical protein [Paenibacillus terrae]|nr:hypothetical protein [Paenibacillus terrae]
MYQRMNPIMIDRSKLKMNRQSNQQIRIRFGQAAELGKVIVSG